MFILHVCKIDNNKSSGVSNVVPEHFINQLKFTDKIAMLNFNNIKIEKLVNYSNIYNVSIKNRFKVNLIDMLKSKPDLVVFHEVYKIEYIFLAPKLRKLGIPYIIIPHGCLTKESQKIKKFKKIIGNKLIFNKFINNAKYIQYLSEKELLRSSKFNNKNKMFVLGNGCEINKETKSEFSNKGLKLLYIGRYSIYTKGLDVLLNSCKKIKNYMIENDIQLNLFGTGNDGIKKVKQIVKNNKIEDIVTVNGPIYSDEKIEILKKHDIFIQLSRTEGQPLALMEALGMGLPALVSDGTCFAEVILKNNMGFVANGENEAALKIKECYERKNEFVKLGNNAKQFINNNYAWERIAQNSIKQYMKIIEENL